MSFSSNKITPLSLQLGEGSTSQTTTTKKKTAAANAAPPVVSPPHHRRWKQPQQPPQQQRPRQESRPSQSLSYGHDDGGGGGGGRRNDPRRLQHLYVLPVLLLEFLALALTRAVIPELLLESFGDNIYFVMGCAECVRGLLAFISCPLFGKVSDVVGRKSCLLITVFGTCLPVCSLAVLTFRTTGSSGYDTYGVIDYDGSSASVAAAADEEYRRMRNFVVLLALSGMFSSTFTLTFAYISDTVRKRKDRVSAYGLALATFGLSFTIGPMAGGYLAHIEGDDLSVAGGEEDGGSHMKIHPLGQQRVFTASFILTVIDLLYIYFFLPESMPPSHSNSSSQPNPHQAITDDDDSTTSSCSSIGAHSTFSQRWHHVRTDIIPNAWSPLDTLRIFSGDPFLHRVGAIALLYYTALHALVSTLQLYAVKRFHLGPERLGELMSALGLSTMVSEAVLVRVVVPSLGEKRSVRIGLVCFAVQCAVLGVAYEGWHLFVCVVISMGSNLVYPSLTSMVSEAVGDDMVGEALGAINGVKALTEGLGPLCFGALMTFSEHSSLPGWPYLVASFLAYLAYRQSQLLPDDDDDRYISESYAPSRRRDGNGLIRVLHGIINSPIKARKGAGVEMKDGRGGPVAEVPSNEEYVSLLSEVDECEVDEEGFLSSYNEQTSPERLGTVGAGQFEAVSPLGN